MGLYADYGSAQRLYFSLGYKPDGQGIHYSYKFVAPGTKVILDDDLCLFYVKDLLEATE